MGKDIKPIYKALHVLFYDQDITEDAEVNCNEEECIEYTAELLAKLNKSCCPFKVYGCECSCSSYVEKCDVGLIIDCGKESKEVWKEFINI